MVVRSSSSVSLLVFAASSLVLGRGLVALVLVLGVPSW
jgi:hypothetical protein